MNHRVTALAAAISAQIWAQQAAQSLTLQVAIRTAYDNNGVIAAGRNRIAAARGLVTQAALHPNPRLNLQQENIRAWQQPDYGRDTDTFLYLTLPLEAAKKRQGRVAKAETSRQRVEAEFAVLKHQLQARVALAYWPALGAVEVQKLLSEAEQTLARTVLYTEARVNEGAAPGADLLRIQLERQRVQSMLATAGQEAARAAARLYQEMGVPQPPRVAFGDDISRLSELSPPDDLAPLLDRRPDVAAARIALAEAEANARLQRLLARPDPEVNAGYKRTGGYDTLLIGVQIPLPARNRNQGLIEAADAETDVARELLRSARFQASAEIGAARTDYEMKLRVVRQLLPSMLLNARRAADLANAAWREGGVDLMRFLDAERTRIDTEIQSVRGMTEFQISAAQLALSLGAIQ